MLLSLQLFRRYKQHLANSAPNGSKCSELQGLLLCYPPSIYTGFTQALHWRDLKHFHSHRLCPIVAPAASPRPAMGNFCNLEKKATHGSLTGWSLANLAGACSCKVGGCEDGLTFQQRTKNPSQGCAKACPETNNVHFKICIYMI